ncbi:MAG: 50S ribosomal protein L25 [Ignavibacteria bacterium]|nr:50S ribosomal protein L25 [Ignavibacteria bacterium]
MSEVILKATKRVPGKAAAKLLRKEGNIPGVYYTKNQDPIHFSVNSLAIRPVVYTAEAKIVSLQVDGSKGLNCILKEVKFDPITDKIVHFDLLGVAAGEMIVVDIPIHLIGQSIGVREGGVIEHVIHKVHVKVDPSKMPEHIDIDVTNMNIGDAVHISDISVAGVEFLDKPEAVIATIMPPKTADVAADAGEVVEPKLVGEDE